MTVYMTIISNPFYFFPSLLVTLVFGWFGLMNLYYYYCYYVYYNFMIEFLKKYRFQVPFLEKYKNTLESMENTSVDETILENKKNSFVIENTPQGLVIMTWNQQKERFEYYSDKKDIPYRFLDVVCRKFVTTNSCKCIYVDVNDEFEKCKNQLEDVKKKLTEEKKKKENEKKNSLFISVKKNTENKEKEEEYQIKDEDLLIKDNVNIFKHVGMIRDFKMLKGPPLKEVKQLTYADFMK